MQSLTATPGSDALLVLVAEAQHGVIGRPELRALGFDDAAVARRLRSGRLHRVHRGVYALSSALTPHGRYLAAVKAAGEYAVLSHRSAAALWDLLPDNSPAAHVTVPFTSGVRSTSGLTVHRARGPIEVTTRAGIPVTTLARTLADLAEVVRPRRLEKALERAHARNLLDVAAIDAVAAAHPGRRGPALVRRLVRAHDVERTTRSGLEDAFLELCDRYGIPRPLVNARVEGLEVDCCWPDARLIVELDGYAWHSHRAAFRNDRAKTRRLVAAGWTVVRVADDEIADEPARIAAEVAALRAARWTPPARVPGG